MGMRRFDTIRPMSKIFIIAVSALSGIGFVFPAAAQDWPTLTAADRKRYDAIYAPTVVAVPPMFANRDFCVLPDGRLRHYGATLVGGRKSRTCLESRNLGLDWYALTDVPVKDVGAMIKCPWAPYYLTVSGAAADEAEGSVVKKPRPLQAFRSTIGPGDENPEHFDFPAGTELGFFRQPTPLPRWKRWIVTGATGRLNGRSYHAAYALSKDDGKTWTYKHLEPNVDASAIVPPDKGHRWDNGCCEPSVAELSDGSLLMIVRTTPGNHYCYRSKDGGDTWTGPDRLPQFYMSNTYPDLIRLRDGRLLFFWNNTCPLPKEPPEKHPECGKDEHAGIWETVFTNRDALHAAISEDDGKTWIGFREFFLNEIRDRADFRELGNSPIDEIDKSVHQSQGFELPDGKVILAVGQNPSARRLIVFDPKWLYETTRKEDFRHGLGNVSTHLYVTSFGGGYRGWAGHCAWNRVPGALLVPIPPTPGNKLVRDVLQLCRIRDPRLVSDRQGVVWNFPAARKGRVTVDCRIDGAGFRFTLADRWFNPCDEYAAPMSPVSFDVTAETVGGPKAWKKVALEWDFDAKTATLAVDGRRETRTIEPGKFSPFGPCYIHLQTLAEGEDPVGTYFRSFEKE